MNLFQLKKLSFITCTIFLVGFITSCDTAKKVTSTTPTIVKDPYLTFEQPFVDFGEINVGENKSFTYKFTNTGVEDVTIELVSGCECTDLDWPMGKTFKPGESGSIKATFISGREEDRGELKKTIDILLVNTDPKTGYQIVKEVKYRVVLKDQG